MVGCLINNDLETSSNEAVVVYFRVKINVTPRHAYAGTDGRWRCSTYPFATSALEAGGWSAKHPAHFNPGNTRVPNAEEALFKRIIPGLTGRIEPPNLDQDTRRSDRDSNLHMPGISQKRYGLRYHV
jgi:hypothetical protein